MKGLEVASFWEDVKCNLVGMLHMAEAKRIGTGINARSESGKEGTGTEFQEKQISLCWGEGRAR